MGPPPHNAPTFDDQPNQPNFQASPVTKPDDMPQEEWDELHSQMVLSRKRVNKAEKRNKDVPAAEREYQRRWQMRDAACLKYAKDTKKAVHRVEEKEQVERVDHTRVEHTNHLPSQR